MLGNLAHIEVSQFDGAALGEEDVGALNVTVHNFEPVQCIQTRYHLVENGPHVGFLHVGARFFQCVDFGLQIAAVSKLHHDAERRGRLLEKGFFVAGDVGMRNGCENTHLVDCVVLFLLTQFLKQHLKG